MSAKEKEFREPGSLADGEALRIRLTREIESIQSQLGDRDRTDENGDRLSSSQYWEWRKKAQHSLHLKLTELRGLKQWLRKKRFENSDKFPGNVTPSLFEEAVSLLSEMHQLAKAALQRNPDRDVQTKLDATQAFLDRVHTGE